MRATVAYGAITLTLVFVPSVAVAQTASPVALEWSAPRGCPDRDYVLAATTRILGQSKGARQAVTARASVVHAAHQRWQVSLTTRTGDTEGERTLEARSCQALADTVGLILALAASPESPPPVVAPAVPPPALSSPAAPPPSDLPLLAPVLPAGASASPPATSAPVTSGAGGPAASAPSASAVPTASSPTGGPAPPAPPSVTPESVPPTTGPRKSPSTTTPPASPAASPPVSPPGSSGVPASGGPHHLIAAVSAAGSFGPLPSLAVGGEVALGVRFWHLRGEVAASYWGAQSSSSLNGVAPDASSRISLVAGDVRAGYVLSVWHVDLVPTVVAELDLSQARSINVTSPQSSSAPWLSLGGGGWVYWNLTRALALRVGVEGLVPLARPVFTVNDPKPGNARNVATAFEPGAVGGKGTLGVEVHFL